MSRDKHENVNYASLQTSLTPTDERQTNQSEAQPFHVFQGKKSFLQYCILLLSSVQVSCY